MLIVRFIFTSTTMNVHKARHFDRNPECLPLLHTRPYFSTPVSDGLGISTDSLKVCEIALTPIYFDGNYDLEWIYRQGKETGQANSQTTNWSG